MSDVDVGRQLFESHMFSSCRNPILVFPICPFISAPDAPCLSMMPPPIPELHNHVQHDCCWLCCILESCSFLYVFWGLLL